MQWRKSTLHAELRCSVLPAHLQIESNEWYQATHITKKLVSRNWFNSEWNYTCKKLSLFFPTYTKENPYTGFQATALTYLKYQRTQFAAFIRGIQAAVSWNCSCTVHATTVSCNYRLDSVYENSKLRTLIFQASNLSCLKPDVRIWSFLLSRFKSPVALNLRAAWPFAGYLHERETQGCHTVAVHSALNNNNTNTPICSFTQLQHY